MTNLEEELRSLQPDPPSEKFARQIENALGDAGTVAMCHINHSDSTDDIPSSKSFSSIPMLSYVLGIAAVLLVGFYFTVSVYIDGLDKNINTIKVQPSSVVGDLDSPIHGVSSDQLESFSDMPVNGWDSPSINERFILGFDEGVVDRISGVPARKFRYHYVDETMWTHPESDTRVLTTTPRQEVFLIDLELY